MPRVYWVRLGLAAELVALYEGRATSVELMVLLVVGGTSVKLVWRQEVLLEGRGTTAELRYGLLNRLLSLLLVCILLLLQGWDGSILIYQTNRNNI